ncbi:MAG: transketolase, partial [Pseudomonadota bacterium]|nr:transketolase [Pseudomonadota bacterium]
PEAIIIATGSELAIAMDAAARLAKDVKIRVVSMPCAELFLAQDKAYRDAVLPKDVTARVVIEAGSTAYWYRFVGTEGKVIGLDHFGASAPYQTLYEKFGLTADAVVEAVEASLAISLVN